MSLFTELKRRNVFRVAIAYLALAWLLIEVSDTVFPVFGIPDWGVRLVVIASVLGFIPTLVFSWAYEITPEGLKREKDVVRDESITHLTAKRLDGITIGLIVAALAFILADRFWLRPWAVEQSVVPAEVATEKVQTSEPEPIEPQYPPNSIAVLPFVNMSDDDANEYFADGIAEELLNLLTKIPELRVTARSSAFAFKGEKIDIPEVAKKLKVANILEGSVRKAGNQVRITAQLVKASDGYHLWSETYDRELENIFAIQDEIAAAVVDALKIALLGETPKTTTTDPEAYALFLQARHFTNQYTVESFKRAETLLSQALEIDPSFAPAWTELAYVYERQTQAFGLRPIKDGIELARYTIQRALTIDPQYGRAYAILARVQMFYDWDFAAADQNLQQAIKLNPRDPAILIPAGRLNRMMGRLDKAIDLYKQSIDLDPVWAAGHFRLGQALYNSDRLDEAKESIQMALSLSPGGVGAQLHLGLVLVAQGDAPAALLAMEQETNHGFRLEGIAIVQHVLGDAGASDAALRALIECCAAEGAYQIALVYASRGEIDNAFGWLEQAYDNRDGGLTSMLVLKHLANLHDDPRWEPLLNKVGLLTYWREMEER